MMQTTSNSNTSHLSKLLAEAMKNTNLLVAMKNANPLKGLLPLTTIANTEGLRVTPYIDTNQHTDKGKRNVGVYTPAILLETFDTLVEENRTALIARARRVVGSDMAEDVVQEALTKAYKHLKNKEEPYVIRKNRLQALRNINNKSKKRQENIENPAAWLHAIVYNTACNFYISRKKLLSFLNKLSEMRDEKVYRFEDPEKHVLRAEASYEIRNLVHTLPELYKKAIELRYFEEYSFQKIAEELECPVSTAKSYVKRGTEILRQLLEGQRRVKNGKLVRHKRGYRKLQTA